MISFCHIEMSTMGKTVGKDLLGAMLRSTQPDIEPTSPIKLTRRIVAPASQNWTMRQRRYHQVLDLQLDFIYKST